MDENHLLTSNNVLLPHPLPQRDRWHLHLLCVLVQCNLLRLDLIVKVKDTDKTSAVLTVATAEHTNKSRVAQRCVDLQPTYQT